jgi:hypothetical protein
MRSIPERTGSTEELYRRLMENMANNLRVAMPGIIQAFDASTQTATVQLALREKIRDLSGNINQVEIPLLLDVPVVLPRAGAFILTMPVQKGDECLVVFADMCIDAWFSHGGVQNQLEKRRHDLSDAFAILGAWSQPNKISNYSTTSAQLRNEAGTSYIEIKNNEINIVSPTVKVNGVVV